jgi:AsmA protein
MISFGGIVPYVGRSLALSGIIRTVEKEGVIPQDTAFFIGGSWDAPFISAVLPSDYREQP